MAHGGEVIVSEGTSHLAGRLPGVRYVHRGRAHLKGIADPVSVIRVAPEDEESQIQPRILMFFASPKRLSWGVGLGVMLIAAATAVAVVYLTSGNTGERSTAAPIRELAGGGADARRAGVLALIPADLGKHCVKQPVANVGAVETAVCVPPAGGTGFSPDRWDVSIYPSGRAVRQAYGAERRTHDLAADQGKCNRLTWGGDGPWSHGPGKPGGRRLCYFDRNDAVIVWIHERLGQGSHRDVLAVAREGGSDHARLTSWWGYAHHLIGKLE